MPAPVVTGPSLPWATVRRSGLLPWERLLLVAAVVVGVVTMHATPVLCPAEPARDHASVGASQHDAGTVLVDEQQGGDCGMQHALAACLAILGAGLLLLAARLLRLLANLAAPDRRAAGSVAAIPARAPPPTTAVRLAQLCVSRR